MDDTVNDSFCSTEAADSPVGLNRGRLFDPDDADNLDESVQLPETRSPQLPKRTSHSSSERNADALQRDFSQESNHSSMSEPRGSLIPASPLSPSPLCSWEDDNMDSAAPSIFSADLNASAEAPTSLLEAPPSTEFASSTSSSLHDVPVLDNDLEGVVPTLPSTATEQRNTSEVMDIILISDDDDEEDDAVNRLEQVMEDERYAGILQARFDLEVARNQIRDFYIQQLQQTLREVNTIMQSRHNDPLSLVRAHRNRYRALGFLRQNRHLGQDGVSSADVEGNDYEALLEFEAFQGSVKPKGLSLTEIQRFPTITFSRAANSKNTQCHICFCEYSDDERLKILPCFHDYHVECIDKWLKDNETCPLCRTHLRNSDVLNPEHHGE